MTSAVILALINFAIAGLNYYMATKSLGGSVAIAAFGVGLIVLVTGATKEIVTAISKGGRT